MKADIPGCPNTTSDRAQSDTELLLLQHYDAVLAPQLFRKNHVMFCKNKLGVLPEWVQGLHASRPWLVYWTLHAADLLGALPELYATVAEPASIRAVLQSCFNYDIVAEGKLARKAKSSQSCSEITQQESRASASQKSDRRRRCGGFGGGPFQMPHLAASYAAVMSLLILEETVPATTTTSSEDKDSNDDETSFNPSTKTAWRSIVDVPWDAVSSWFESLSLDVLEENESVKAKSKNVNRGGFAMHIGGECDVRGSYIVATIAACIGRIGIQQQEMEAEENEKIDQNRGGFDGENDRGGKSVAPHINVFFPRAATRAYINRDSYDFVLRCQRYEGGFSCGPLSPEVHGGYGQCALSALMYWLPILAAESFSTTTKSPNFQPSASALPPLPNITTLRRWLTQRQMALPEGGFQGRTNKLVDSCYSHWIGTTFVLLEVLCSLGRAIFCPAVAQNLLPRLLNGVGSDLFYSSTPSSAQYLDPSANGHLNPTEMWCTIGFSMNDALNLHSSNLVDLLRDNDCKTILRTLVVLEKRDEEEKEVARADEKLKDAGRDDSEAEKILAVENFLSDAKTTVKKQTYNDTTHNASFATNDEDAFEDVDDEDDDGTSLVRKALLKYTNDGAGTLLCNQRALQQYVFRYCQNLRMPASAAPKPATTEKKSDTAAPVQNANDENDEIIASETTSTLCQADLAEGLIACLCAFSPSTAAGDGGLMDKPEHPNDSYHTCYSLSGVASMQQGQMLSGLKRDLTHTRVPTSHAVRLLEAIDKLQTSGRLPPATPSNAHEDTMISLFAGAKAQYSNVIFGYENVIGGRIEEDGFYADSLIATSSVDDDQHIKQPTATTNPSDSMKAPVQQSTLAISGTDAWVRINPNSSNKSSLLSPTNPMANIASRHFAKKIRPFN